jgi:hypothetical protein
MYSFFGILILAIILRVAAAGAELWSDELLPMVGYIRTVKNPLEFFFIRDVSNQVLNSLWLFTVRSSESVFVVRGLSLCTGVATVALAYSVADGGVKGCKMITALLFSVAFPMVLYSSEAKGYAPVGFFTLAAYALRFRAEDRFPPVVFWAACVLGFLSHMVFFIVLFIFLACDVLVPTDPVHERFQRFVRLYLFPVSAMLLFGLVYFAAPVMLNGTLHYSFGSAFRETLTLPFGFPPTVIYSLLAAFVIVAAIFAAWQNVQMSLCERTCILSMMAFPCSLFFVGYFYGNWGGRFVLPSYIFLFLVLGRAVAAVVASPLLWRRGAGILVLFLIVSSSLMADVQQIRVGKGGYTDLLQRMVQESGGGGVAAMGDNASTAVILAYLAEKFSIPVQYEGDLYQFFVPSKWFTPIPSTALPPEWYIVSDRKHLFQPTPEIAVRGVTYAYVDSRMYFREAGKDWHLYRRKE